MLPHEVLERFANICNWQRRGERAPHKPLLILYALSRLRQGETQINYIEYEEKMLELLEEFGPPRKRHEAKHPFLRLANDGIWRLSEKDLYPFREQSVIELRQRDLKAVSIK